MSRMKMGWLLGFLLFFAASTKADSVYVNGSYAFADHGFGIGPYGGTLNGQSASFYCVDFVHQISGQTGWTAAVTGLPSTSGYGSTYQQSQTTYLEMAWLITQMISPSTWASLTGQSNQTVQAELQWTIWSLSGLGGTTNPYPSWTTYFANNAAANYGSVTGGWEILTPNPKGSYGQEFIVRTPEPGMLLLLCVGLAGLVAFSLKRRGFFLPV